MLPFAARGPAGTILISQVSICILEYCTRWKLNKCLVISARLRTSASDIKHFQASRPYINARLASLAGHTVEWALNEFSYMYDPFHDGQGSMRKYTLQAKSPPFHQYRVTPFMTSTMSCFCCQPDMKNRGITLLRKPRHKTSQDLKYDISSMCLEDPRPKLAIAPPMSSSPVVEVEKKVRKD